VACESRSNKFAALAAKISGGISNLASKRSFYAGVAVGSAGTAALTAVVNKLRRQRQRSGRPALIRVSGDSNAAGSRTNPKPLAGIERTNAAGSRANPRPLAGIRPPNTTGSRANPKPLAGVGRANTADSRANPKPLAGIGRANAASNRATPGSQIGLKPDRITVSLGAGKTMILPDSYRLVQADGSDTGLALTPDVLPDGNGGHQPGHDWMITHTDSGLAMGGPYSSAKEAQSVAARLSVVVGDGSLSPAEKMAAAQKIITQSKGV